MFFSLSEALYLSFLKDLMRRYTFPKFVGVCKAMMVRYFFNVQTGYCELFLYGGCGGNRNNFLTLEDCRQTCHPKAQSLW
ncbi:hypothetical protein FD754_015813 [Muntiacus muntjak]|uniref:BPTI/Kunitz inhibitor domain-containing protein n=1 Tax=Muntiacus muntjak TaxID=9888 RepID=A0A5N3VSD4_MUNMU|nr:hypothetical protein FD754_015813 [Muntiacus muntjak]